MKRLLTFALVAVAALSQAQTAPKKGSKSGSTSKSSSEKTSAAKPKTETAKEPSKEDDSVQEGPSTDGPAVAAVSSIEVEDIQNFEHYAPQIQQLIRKSLALTKLNLTYTFGSADPKKGGMDCSGTIYYVLHDFGFKGVPRQSNEMAGWVKDKTLLHRVQKADTLSHPEFSALQPGDLLFWSGTYEAGPREIPVTHVMLNLGKLKKSGKHVVFGASDGRAYQGKRRTGVSVFDFSLPKSTSSASFYGFGMIPGVGKIEVKPEPEKPVVVAASGQEISPIEKSEKTKGPAGAPKAQPERPTVSTVASKSDSSPIQKTEGDAEKTTSEKPEVVEAKSEMAQATATVASEEIRPAIRIKPETGASSTLKESAPEQTAITPEPKTPKESVVKTTQVASAPKSATAKPKSTAQNRSTPTKPKSVVKKKAAPPPPTPLAKAKRAAGDFFEEVKRSLPSGR
ncbi:C40 family peptidase [Prosthecobacter dejongeii]|uniref:Cell wall-associated NlpC family hydrolase n=1 Tax=Prosthecobacter dejongeii TaxID=48465 RepID=A0A7W7YN97_9BACT|nr:NlpC/P60 family protein [Prosthecobacter dejongeii]MBB5039309.1 cell wall-associated NlpC family hydrolase [Prosthecobacter dejongeii]